VSLVQSTASAHSASLVQPGAPASRLEESAPGASIGGTLPSAPGIELAGHPESSVVPSTISERAIHFAGDDLAYAFEVVVECSLNPRSVMVASGYVGAGRLGLKTRPVGGALRREGRRLSRGRVDPLRWSMNVVQQRLDVVRVDVDRPA